MRAVLGSWVNAFEDATKTICLNMAQVGALASTARLAGKALEVLEPGLRGLGIANLAAGIFAAYGAAKAAFTTSAERKNDLVDRGLILGACLFGVFTASSLIKEAEVKALAATVSRVSLWALLGITVFINGAAGVNLMERIAPRRADSKAVSMALFFGSLAYLVVPNFQTALFVHAVAGAVISGTRLLRAKAVSCGL